MAATTVKYIPFAVFSCALLAACIAVFSCALLAACIRASVPSIVLQRDRAIADLALRDYRRTLPLPDQFQRAEYCVAEATLEQYGDGGVDAGGDIECHPPLPPTPPAKGSPEALCSEGLSCSGDMCTCLFKRDAGE